MELLLTTDTTMISMDNFPHATKLLTTVILNCVLERFSCFGNIYEKILRKIDSPVKLCDKAIILVLTWNRMNCFSETNVCKGRCKEWPCVCWKENPSTLDCSSHLLLKKHTSGWCKMLSRSYDLGI